MKLIRRAVMAIVLLLIIAVAVVFFSLDRIVKSTVQSQATSSLNLNTTLQSASLSLFGGKISLKQLEIGSPKGFTAPQMLSVGDTSVAVNYGQLSSEPIHVSTISIDKPQLVIENHNGVLNFKQAMDDMPKSDSAPSNSKPLKLIIDDLKLTDPQVIVKGIGAADIPVSLPSIELKNIGTGDGSKNGAAVQDVIKQVITAMAASASSSSALSAEFKQVLNANVNAAVSKLEGDAQKRIAGAIPGPVGQSLSHLISDPKALSKDPGKAVENMLEGNATTQPGDKKKPSIKDLEGLLGGNKSK